MSATRTKVTSKLSFAAIACTLIACRKPPAADTEALALARAYEAVTSTSLSERSIAIDSFKVAQCKVAQNCADRDACVTYATALLRAQTLADKARALSATDAGGNGAATKSELTLIVDGADQALKSAEKAEPDCTKALHALYARARPELQ